MNYRYVNKNCEQRFDQRVNIKKIVIDRKRIQPYGHKTIVKDLLNRSMRHFLFASFLKILFLQTLMLCWLDSCVLYLNSIVANAHAVLAKYKWFYNFHLLKKNRKHRSKINF